MRKFSQINEGKLNLTGDTVNYLSAGELKKYYEKEKNNFYKSVPADIAKSSDHHYTKTLHPAEATEFIINYLIQHNADYVQDLGKGTPGNALAAFFSRSLPTDPEKKKLYQAIAVLNNSMRLKEVPVFMTKQEYDDVMSGNCTLDYVVYDMSSESGRNKLAKQYDGLCHMFAHKYNKRAKHDYDDWVGTARMALVDAMNMYYAAKGKIKSSKKNDDNTFDASDVNADAQMAKDIADQKKGNNDVKFLTFASWKIMFWMIGMQEDSHLVRIPKSAQARIRKEQGKNIYDNTSSIDQKLGTGSSKDEGNNKTLGDTLGTANEIENNLNREDQTKLFNALFRALKKRLSREDYAIFLTHDGQGGLDKIGNSEWSDILTHTKQADLDKLYDAIESFDNKAEKTWIEKFKAGGFAKRIDKPKGAGKSSVSIKYGNVIKMIRTDKNLFKAMSDIREDHEAALNMKDRERTFEDVFDTKNMY